MPTQHVEPDSHDVLQDIANALLKARKVVVVTGAGISTNSGIPDFRSENGLYSLIQAQFDAASQHVRPALPAVKQESVQDHAEPEPPRKRRKISRESSPDTSSTSQETREEIEVRVEANSEEPELPRAGENVDTKHHNAPITVSDALDKPCISTPQPKLPPSCAVQLTTSPLSSPPSEDFMIPPSSLRPHMHKRLTDVSRAIPSSPLSSPPPVLFDPFQPNSPSNGSMSRRSSTTPSEVDDGQTPPNNPPASQSSNPGKLNLPNMKGKDLFDASIWADPTRTSVFYKFATSLRQKVREAEPTSSHKFISHLRDRGKLVRCYTQNIDQIEEKVGLSTSLQDGPGSRGRFSRKLTANTNQLNKMVEEVSSGNTSDATPSEKPSQSGNETSQTSQPESAEDSNVPSLITAKQEEDPSPADEVKIVPLPKREPPRSGVECVFLHGSLELLRCFQCGQVCSWDDDDREMETLCGEQPECPHCVGATEARKERGKRALGVGKLRPDIVLYGEEHPNAHLISPIVTHDLALYPDMLLILGTSLRVHGLKVMVREFAKTVHSRGGNVVFVNFTKPPESSWGDIIDYWIQWDCDAWVSDLQIRVPKLWQAPDPPKPKKKRESGGVPEQEDKKRPPAANPVALRDTKFTGAYCTLKIIRELHRITNQPPPPSQRHTPIATTNPITTVSSEGLIQVTMEVKEEKPKPKSKRQPRKSAPGTLEKPKRTSSTLNPNHGRGRKQQTAKDTPPANPPTETKEEISSILYSVKSNPRIRKRKMIDGEEVAVPTAGKRRSVAQSAASYKPTKAELKLPPLRPERVTEPMSPYGRPQPIEPKSPPAGPLATLSVNMRAAMKFSRPETFYLEDPLVKLSPQWPAPNRRIEQSFQLAQQHQQEQQGASREEAEANAALALAGLKTGSPVVNRAIVATPRSLEGDLMSWGANWSTNR
ncbi:NAD-dependent histone deacetylase HST3 [Cladobotryum mycophilum]|uniref:NAD-dependent histone deacetylase HST3 n=1 Tax=Cladobotryum mycophilum TaxID=491253 RepID=A0ABR0SXS5_9HYPO